MEAEVKQKLGGGQENNEEENGANENAHDMENDNDNREINSWHSNKKYFYHWKTLSQPKSAFST